MEDRLPRGWKTVGNGGQPGGDLFRREFDFRVHNIVMAFRRMAREYILNAGDFSHAPEYGKDGQAFLSEQRSPGIRLVAREVVAGMLSSHYHKRHDPDAGNSLFLQYGKVYC